MNVNPPKAAPGKNLRNPVSGGARLPVIPFTAFVPADGLCDKGDNLHFNSRSLYEFGLRYFDAFEKFDISANGEGASDPDALKLTEMELL